MDTPLFVSFIVSYLGLLGFAWGAQRHQAREAERWRATLQGVFKDHTQNVGGKPMKVIDQELEIQKKRIAIEEKKADLEMEIRKIQAVKNIDKIRMRAPGPRAVDVEAS